MKKWALTSLFLMIIIISPMSIHAEEIWTNVTDDWLDDDEVAKQWDEILSSYRDYLPISKDKHWLDAVREGSIFSPKDWIRGITDFFIHEWIVNGRLLGMLIFLTLLSVFLRLLINSFENESVSKVSYIVIFGVLLTLAISSFQQAADYTTGAISGMGNFMIALLPLMLSVMAAFGNIASVAFFNPIILFFVQFSGIIIGKIVLPLFFLSAILSIVSTINSEYNVTRLANLLKQAAFFILGGFLTLFLSVMSLQGVNAAVSDGVAIRAAKFVTSNFIPVVGRMFTDATDTVFSASVLLKNAIGLAGVIVIMIITLFPALKVLVLALIFRISAAILQPIADGPIVDAIDTMGKHILYIFTALLAVSLMFFFSLVMLVIVGNLTLMIR
ncbi:stage III sporulation protein AE [Bacillaceae bacterium W0354]